MLIIDEVISAGTATRESIAIIQAAGAQAHAVAIALDRQEKATENGMDVNYSAVQYVRNQLGLHVFSIARLTDLLQYLAHAGGAPQAGAEVKTGDLLLTHYQRVLDYRQRYGVD